jgi:non-structural maintenance of chromosomes element 4
MVRLVADLLRKNSPINLFEFVVNPRSYGQTIENIFYLSFSVRDARARIDLDARGLPILKYVDALTDEEMELENKQCVLEMTMQYWEDLIRALDITESVIPHRHEQQQTATAQTWY